MESSKLTLRPYQEECVQTIDKLPDGSRAIVALATGLGKTVCFSRFARQGRMLILSHRDELVRQPEKYFDCSFGIEKAEEHENGEEVVSASIQTLSRGKRLEQFSPDDFDIVIVDEAHHAAAPSYRKVIDYFHPRKLIGMTATPKRGDGVKLDDIFDQIAYSKDLLWGIQNGYLSHIRCLAVKPDIDISNVKFSMGDYNIGDLMKKFDVDAVFRSVAETYMKYCHNKDRHTVIYCLSVNACNQILNKIKKKIPKEEWDQFAIVTASSSFEERRAVEERFMSGEVKCLLNCMVLTEGTDLPIIDTIIVARPTANEVLYTQIIGRGTRLAEGKKECLILDILPQSDRKLCSVLSLAGFDWEDKERLETEGIDITDYIEEKKNEFKEQLTLYIEEFNFFDGLYKSEERNIAANKKSGVMGFCKNIQDIIAKQREQATEEDGEYNFGPMIYQIGRSDEDRYIIRGKIGDYTFRMSRPDMLGNTIVRATCRNQEYISKPIKMQEAIDSIWKILMRNCLDTRFLWNANSIRYWHNVEATDKQINYLESLMKRRNMETGRTSGNLSKYDASMMINYLKQHDDLGLQLFQMKTDIIKKKAEQKKNEQAGKIPTAEKKEEKALPFNLLLEQPTHAPRTSRKK